jgi:hypothetical protein
MNATVFLATTGSGLARAERLENGDWSVTFSLQDQNPRCLAADPHNTEVVYAGTQGNGVLRSADRGKSWSPAGMEDQTVKSLAVNPHDPDVIYAGTRPAYLYITRDGGDTWHELDGFRRIRGRWFWMSPAEKPYKAYVQAIAVSPEDPNVILAGIEFGAVVLSIDAGRTWSGHRSGSLRDCHNLKFHTSDGNWVYEAGGTGGGASVSRDGGHTWRNARSGLAKPYGVTCAADPERPERWYVSVAPGPGKAYGRQAEAYLYRSEGDGGWQPIGWEAHPMGDMPIALVTDPAAPGHLYAGLVYGDVRFSADYGDSWEKLPFSLKSIWTSLLVI